jgi:ATP-dependent RNA helicase DDX46/PRP5
LFFQLLEETSNHDAQPTPVVVPEVTDAEKLRERKKKLEAWKAKKKAEEEQAKKLGHIPGRILPDIASTSIAANGRVNAFSPMATVPAKGMCTYWVMGLTNIIQASNGTALPMDRPVSTFGLTTKSKVAIEKAKRGAIDFGDDDNKKLKLERLPSPIPGEATADTELAEDDDDTVMQEGTEEEAAAAARAAAAQRAERLAAEEAAAQPVTSEGGMDVDEDDIDPLDAFMAGVETEKANAVPVIEKKEEAILDNAEDVDITAEDQDPDDILALANKMKKKKELPTVDHGKINYEPFRRNFYKESVELQQMTEEEVDYLRMEMDGIKIRVSQPPSLILFSCVYFRTC